MTKQRKKQITFLEKLRKIKGAGLNQLNPPNRPVEGLEDVEQLEIRIKKVLEIFDRHKKYPNNMLFFIMYDIENNKIRTHIAKYLIRNGCQRVQKSIFLADTTREVFNDLHKTIREVQEIYDNNDSVVFVPVSVDQLQAMKIIGQQIELDLVLGNKNTLFF